MDTELYQDDPLAGLTRQEAFDYLTSMGIDVKNPTGAMSDIVSRAKRRTESVAPDISADVSGLSELADAYSKVIASTKKPTTSTGPATIEDILSADPSTFDLEGPESVLLKKKPTSGAGDEAKAQEMVQVSAAEKKDAAIAAAEAVIDKKIGSDNTPVEKAFAGAMDEYINAVRGSGPEKRERTLDEYKKEFAEATGVDISGKVDKSQALMAFGLALMQNRAGKGFNVGKMLSSVGEAGQAALPALEKAKETARNSAIAAGKYALESRSSDRAADAASAEKAMNRGKYWIYKKGGKGAEFSNFDDGEFVDLNAYELNQLINNKDFDNQYEFIDAKDRLSILEKRAEGVDPGDMYSAWGPMSLIGGKADEAPAELQIMVAPVDQNYKGVAPARYKIQEAANTVISRFSGLQQSISSGAAKFEELIGYMDKGITVPDQIIGTLKDTARNFGIDIGEGPSNVKDAQRILNEIAVREATNILQESGKTLSDQDRQRVQDLVGEINFASGDVELVKKKLKSIYDLTVVKPQRNLDRAVEWLESNAGIQLRTNSAGMPTQAELDAMNKMYDTNFTMDDYKAGS